MPYIDPVRRVKYSEILRLLPEMDTKGDLEYCIFYLMKRFVYRLKKNYSNLHDTVYAAIHCGDEFRRRYLDIREDDARCENGDIIGVE